MSLALYAGALALHFNLIFFSFVEPGQRNWYSDWDLGRISEGSWFYSRQGLEIAALSRAVRSALGPSQPIPQVRRGQSLQLNQPQHEAATHPSVQRLRMR